MAWDGMTRGELAHTANHTTPQEDTTDLVHLLQHFIDLDSVGVGHVVGHEGSLDPVWNLLHLQALVVILVQIVLHHRGQCGHDVLELLHTLPHTDPAT